jgi:hypothetical protein
VNAECRNWCSVAPTEASKEIVGLPVAEPGAGAFGGTVTGRQLKSCADHSRPIVTNTDHDPACCQVKPLRSSGRGTSSTAPGLFSGTSVAAAIPSQKFGFEFVSCAIGEREVVVIA